MLLLSVTRSKISCCMKACVNLVQSAQVITCRSDSVTLIWGVGYRTNHQFIAGGGEDWSEDGDIYIGARCLRGYPMWCNIHSQASKTQVKWYKQNKLRINRSRLLKDDRRPQCGWYLHWNVDPWLDYTNRMKIVLLSSCSSTTYTFSWLAIE